MFQGPWRCTTPTIILASTIPDACQCRDKPFITPWQKAYRATGDKDALFFFSFSDVTMEGDADRSNTQAYAYMPIFYLGTRTVQI